MTQTLDELTGEDPTMARAVELCRKIRNSELPLLILGETGVGKDVLARALHAASNRSKRPFVALNCAAIPGSLLASELFGYAPGTFTDGAKKGYSGKIVACNGGTFFLDEIGDMPLDLQAYLLRVLEERCVRPLGRDDDVPVDVRFVSATHCNLPLLVASGRFRQDLYYRIRGVQIELPPLRMRRDLASLIDRIAALEAKSQGKSITLSPQLRDVLCMYPWPGNFRELKSVLRFAIAFCELDQMTVTDVPSQIVEFARDKLRIAERCPT